MREIINNKNTLPSKGNPGGGGGCGGGGSPGAATDAILKKNNTKNIRILFGTILISVKVKKKKLYQNFLTSLCVK